MAKSLRSRCEKANKAKLRSSVFGPAEIARKERLSAKLVKLASESQQRPREDTKITNGEQGRRLFEPLLLTTEF